ncbi:MAG TPA: hypothetical protein VNL91_09520 [Thermoanaerobaculia bacterium]|nr:hypothetical protein [Thermoanaerobaculia bacterium]
MKHYSEAELLETWYTQPGESMPVMMHLAGCPDCAARYERLEGKLRTAAACGAHERPETFWSRQRIAIMRRVERSSTRRISMLQSLRIAAAATLVFVLGGIVAYRTTEPPVETTPATAVATNATASGTAAATGTDDVSGSADPWQSEQLQGFRSVVQWESWVGENGKGNQL